MPSLNKCSLVMELMEQDLRVLMMQRMEAGMNPPFSLAVAVDLMLQIARGMEYLHSESLRIIHRDLKASNILVSFSRSLKEEFGCKSYNTKDLSPFDVHLKVADFGMSKAKYASSGYSTKPVGTTAWRAPEVFRDNPEGDGALHPNAKYTNKADVYSFAMVCYEILTGKVPFEGQYQIQRRVLAGERPTLPSYCLPALASYIGTCWHAEPAQRPAFTHICRLLRYFKACIFLQDQLQKQDDRDPTFVDCLLRSISPAMCTRIDDMMQSLVEQLDCDLQTQPLLLIPLEMYCCREILQNRNYSTEANADDELPAEISGSETGADALTVRSRRNSRGHLVGWLKRLTCCTQGKIEDDTNANSVAGGFTYAQLAAATNNFADTSLLGKGGSAKVYFGILDDGTRLAVKQADYGGGNAAMLSQELRIASQLRHRNVVPLFGWCQAQGKLLLVYEYMPNGDLWQLILNARVGDGSRVMEWELRYKVVNQVATAIKYFHQDSGYKQIVHRDVKMCNIFLDSEWNARVGDCGLALSLEAGERSDGGNRNIIAGTMGYIAPEYASDGIVSPAGDIYAFGVTVLEVATGRKVLESHLVEWLWALYEGGGVMQAADTRLEGRYDEVEMEAVLLLGLACRNRSPQARPDIEEVLRILSGVSLPPPPPPLGPRPYTPLQAGQEQGRRTGWSSTTTSIRL